MRVWKSERVRGLLVRRLSNNFTLVDQQTCEMDQWRSCYFSVEAETSPLANSKLTSCVVANRIRPSQITTSDLFFMSSPHLSPGQVIGPPGIRLYTKYFLGVLGLYEKKVSKALTQYINNETICGKFYGTGKNAALSSRKKPPSISSAPALPPADWRGVYPLRRRFSLHWNDANVQNCFWNSLMQHYIMGANYYFDYY